MSYREQQTDGTGLRTDRRSTVVFEKQAAGQMFGGICRRRFARTDHSPYAWKTESLHREQAGSYK